MIGICVTMTGNVGAEASSCAESNSNGFGSSHGHDDESSFDICETLMVDRCDLAIFGNGYWSSFKKGVMRDRTQATTCHKSGKININQWQQLS